MKRAVILMFIVFLIFLTSFIKNLTKEIDDKILTTQENIGILQGEYENLKLEHSYLTSPKKLLEYKNLFFDDELIPVDIESLNKITIFKDKLYFRKFLDE